MDAVTSEIGKREAHKLATRRAIQDAADELFDARGYAQTTIRDIADAAGVTERTFFRYFSGKESLLVKEIEAWLPILGDEIRARPADEAALDAVQGAFLAMGARMTEDARPNMSWLFYDGPPGPRLEKSAPGLLLRFEQTVADALDDRMGDTVDADEHFANQVTARCAVAAMRSAGIRNWQVGQDTGDPDRPPIELITQAFDVVRRLR
jgi:AcrR family transcriptional regulator